MKVFIAGPRKISLLNKEVISRLENIKNKKITVLVGDANGVDKAVQKYFADVLYDNVLVYASNGSARNNLGKWDIVKVNVTEDKKGFDFYTVKDKEMAKNADIGFMIWNGVSKGTLNNIVNLTKMNKRVLLYFIPQKNFFAFSNLEEFNRFLNKFNADNIKVFNNLINSTAIKRDVTYQKPENLIFEF